jgi:hypothetical protein
MPAKKDELSQKEQSERFRKAVRDLEAAGELNPTDEVDRRLDAVLRKAAPAKPKPSNRE